MHAKEWLDTTDKTADALHCHAQLSDDIAALLDNGDSGIFNDGLREHGNEMMAVLSRYSAALRECDAATVRLRRCFGKHHARMTGIVTDPAA
jgi:hypothetical protein